MDNQTDNSSEYRVSASFSGERFDTFLAEKSGMTRSQIRKSIKFGLATVNSRKVKPGYRLRKGDMVTLIVQEEDEEILIPEQIDLDIVWEDDHIIVVNKPPGMVVHPAAGNWNGTLLNGLARHCKSLATVGAPIRPGVVHRLDKDTSGLIVVAKNNRAYYRLAEQFREREVNKLYVALIYGKPGKTEGEISGLIGRSSADRKKMTTRTRHGKDAVTLYRVVEELGSASLVESQILTGRTHQIRVHFASVGHPVLGDRTYGRKVSVTSRGQEITFPRQMLHAASLSFRHPETGQTIHFGAPLPDDMSEAIKALRRATT